RKFHPFSSTQVAEEPILGRWWRYKWITFHPSLTIEARKAYIQDNQEYDLVTVKRSRGGVIRREHLKGKDISVKSQFYIKEGDFLISKRQIVHGANQWAGPCRSRRTAGSP
ncbi:TPA: hypothetical protein ACX4F7_005180, partial [Escherichia coli]